MCAGKVIAHSRHKIRNFTNSGKVKTNWRWSSTRRTQQPVLTEATAWMRGPLRPRPVPSLLPRQPGSSGEAGEAAAGVCFVKSCLSLQRRGYFWIRQDNCGHDTSSQTPI